MIRSVLEGLLNRLNGSNRIVARIDELRRAVEISDLADVRSSLHGAQVALKECLDRLSDLDLRCGEYPLAHDHCHRIPGRNPF